MKRIIQLDFFRGLFLVVMTSHHFISNNNIINRLTNQSIAWVSAAEGFFFLSGLTAGIVYGRLLMTKGPQALLKATTKRLRTIYVYHIAVTFLIVLCIYCFSYIYTSLDAGMLHLFKDKTTVFLLTPLLLFLPPVLDLLPLYMLFFAVLPFAVRSFFSGKAWHVLIPSVLIYCIGFFYLNHNSSILAFKAGHMPKVPNPFCWQFLFLLGVYAGHLFVNGTLQNLVRKKTIFYPAMVIAASFFLIKVLKINTGIDMSYWANKASLGPLRILNFGSLALCTAHLCTRHRNWFTLKPLCFLGRYSLEVFNLHVLLIYLLRPLLPYLNRFSYAYGSTRIYPVETILLFLVLLSLFTAPYLFRKRRFNRTEIRTATSQFSFFKT